ncbi:MAG: phenylalanine--tRNA ligase subunit beta [Bacillales bacterium]|jgi:phenylalanyl-tRNA synthetase beta chain|nr:phenylalanine--tRNA ligase subunit beta [Bacillales bacterium]
MFVSYKWLQEFVDLTGETPQTLADKITRSGIEVESVNLAGLEIQNVVVGHVLTCEQHPDADKLHVCTVDVGGESPLQIVCGAPNVGVGQLVPVAKVGAVLPGNFKIKQGMLRGVESNGMICSLQELGVESKVTPKEFATGIYQFPAGTSIGTNAVEALYLDDAIIELSLTPNRSDAMSMLGVAYEVAAILGREVNVRTIEYPTSDKKASDFISVKVEAEDNPLYVAKVIHNVKVGPSPLWMQACLIACGVRPHSNIVDITNFVMMEYGQPLHAFDADKLGSKEIVVRYASEGEKFTTLDEEERTLKADQMVITNGKVPVAIAGVMGGLDSSVTEETQTIILEAAYFNGGSVRKTSRTLGLRSESSARFEKNVDPNRVKAAAERAAQLISQFAGGEVAQGSVEVDNLEIKEAVVTIAKAKINKVLGTDLPCETIKDILNRLQFPYECGSGAMTITVPTRRGDITIEEDIIEEIARIYGYDNLPKTLPTAIPNELGLTPYQSKRRQVRQILEGAGLSQAITYSLTSDEKSKQFTLKTTGSIRLAMPMSEERSTMRLSLVPSLLDVVKYNVARQNDNVAVYELGSVFLKNEDAQLPTEVEHLAGAITGQWNTNLWQGEKKAVDFYVLKGILEGLFSKLGVDKMISWKPAQIDGLHPGRTAEIVLNMKERIGYVGQVHPAFAKKEDLKETFVFELDIEKVMNIPVRQVKFADIPKFPSMTRDIALVLDRAVPAEDIKKSIEKAGGRLLKEVNVFDLYEGAHMEPGKKSIAFSLRYFDPAATLTDEAVTEAHSKVLDAVKTKFGAELRG